ncbi:hypothetical protein ACH5RR_000504 [Cinchona calisaya]|uniref:Uncharacterized protein n=1 Tax=Cinchona calisaya TaxID=153742 RepID=A0ABD3B1J4_9GENT
MEMQRFVANDSPTAHLVENAEDDGIETSLQQAHLAAIRRQSSTKFYSSPFLAEMATQMIKPLKNTHKSSIDATSATLELVVDEADPLEVVVNQKLAAKNVAVLCHVVDTTTAVRETDDEAIAIVVEGHCLAAVGVGKNHTASVHIEGLNLAAELVAFPIMKTSEIRDTTATSLQRKSAKNAVGQPRNVVERTEDIVAP